MNTTEIEINGQTYTVDLNKAVADGYLNPKPKVSYHIGMRFKHWSKEEYILAHVKDDYQRHSVCLISLRTGGYYSQSCVVDDVFNITENEWDTLLVGNTDKFTVV